MKETLIDELRRIMAKASSGGSIAPDVEQVIEKLKQNDQTIRQYALQLAINRGTTAAEVVADARKFEEYLRA